MFQSVLAKYQHSLEHYALLEREIMGCDIHLVLEKRTELGKWVGIDTFAGHYGGYGEPEWYSPIARRRNYNLFAALAGVRGEGPEPKGLPDDISDTGALLAYEWGCDGHSHSWLPIAEAARIWNVSSDNPQEGPAGHWFGVEDDDLTKYRIVFWFDN